MVLPLAPSALAAMLVLSLSYTSSSALAQGLGTALLSFWSTLFSWSSPALPAGFSCDVIYPGKPSPTSVAYLQYSIPRTDSFKKILLLYTLFSIIIMT